MLYSQYQSLPNKYNFLRTYTKFKQYIQTVLGFAKGDQIGDLTFLGLMGIMDPPREGIHQAVRILSSANVTVKMITGDAQETAISIGLL